MAAANDDTVRSRGFSSVGLLNDDWSDDQSFQQDKQLLQEAAWANAVAEAEAELPPTKRDPHELLGTQNDSMVTTPDLLVTCQGQAATADQFGTSSSMASELEALFSPQHCSTSGLGQPVQPKQTHPYEGQLAESRLQLQNMHTQVQALRAEASAERATAQRTAAENEGLRCESAQLQGQLKLIRSEMFKLRRLLGEKDADLAAVKKVNAELKRSTVGAECTAGLLELQSNMRDQARKLAIVRARADQKEASLEQQTSELVQLRHELDLKCAELEVGMQRTKAAEAQCSEARAELERLQDARELDQQRVLETAEVEHRNSQLQCKIDELESQLFKHTIEAAPTAASTAVPSCAKRLSRKEMRESEMSRVMGEMQLASPTHADAAQDMDDGLSRDLVRVRSESMQAASVEAMGPSQDADPQSLIPEDRFLV